MFKGAGVTLRTLSGKDEGQDESRGEYIRERKFPEKGVARKISEKGRDRTKTLKEESEQCIILCIISLLGCTCIKAFYLHILSYQVFLPYSQPRVRSSLVV